MSSTDGAARDTVGHVLRAPHGRDSHRCGCISFDWAPLPLAVACMAAPSAPRVSAGTRILFIGNSLTYVNDIPSLVVAVAHQVGDDDIGTAMAAYPDFSLEDHWNEGSAARAIAAQGWDFVVMQQGPSSLPESQRHLAQWSDRFSAPIHAAGATPVLYQVWPHILRRGDAPAVLVS